MQIITIDGKRVMVEEVVKWNGFKRWVEGTMIYHAIKNDPLGTEIQSLDPAIAFQLHKTKDRVINGAEDLPVEVLEVFYMNSPWWQHPTQQGDAGLKNILNQVKQLTNGD